MLFLTKNSRVYYLVDAACVMFDWFSTNDGNGRGMPLWGRRGSSTSVQKWGDKVQRHCIGACGYPSAISHTRLFSKDFLTLILGWLGGHHNWPSLCLSLFVFVKRAIRFATIQYFFVCSHIDECQLCSFVLSNNCLTDQVNAVSNKKAIWSCDFSNLFFVLLTRFWLGFL